MWVFFPRSLIENETKQSLTPESFQMLLSGTRPSCLILVAKKFYCTIWGGNSHWGFLCKWKRRSRRHYRVFMSVLYHDHIRIWKCWFFRGEPENPEPQSKVINQQQTKPTYDIRLELNPGYNGARRVLSLLCQPCCPNREFLTKTAQWTSFLVRV